MERNAFVWGAFGAIICAFIVIVGTISGADVTASPLTADPLRAAGAGFLFGILACNVRNWLNGRRPGL